MRYKILILSILLMSFYICSVKSAKFKYNYYDENINDNNMENNEIEENLINLDDSIWKGNERKITKKNIISALRAKHERRSQESNHKNPFSPVVSVDALGNLNRFFNQLATNMQQTEARRLMPIQQNLLTAKEDLPKDMRSMVKIIRFYETPDHIRSLTNHMPETLRIAESHRQSNFFDPAYHRIGLGK